jgi:hypothetical protein
MGIVFAYLCVGWVDVFPVSRIIYASMRATSSTDVLLLAFFTSRDDSAVPIPPVSVYVTTGEDVDAQAEPESVGKSTRLLLANDAWFVFFRQYEASIMMRARIGAGLVKAWTCCSWLPVRESAHTIFNQLLSSLGVSKRLNSTNWPQHQSVLFFLSGRACHCFRGLQFVAITANRRCASGSPRWRHWRMRRVPPTGRVPLPSPQSLPCRCSSTLNPRVWVLQPCARRRGAFPPFVLGRGWRDP